MKQTNAQAFVQRGLAMKRGRPRKPFHIDRSEYAFIDEPIYRRNYGKSESNPGRYCKNNYCRAFVSDKDAPCRECGSLL